MAAPERFAEMSDSSCNAGAVHTWHWAEDFGSAAISEKVPLAVIAAGLFTGVLAGLFGVGGGAVIVPALYEVFRVLDVPADVRMQLCIGTSLAIIVPTTVRS